MCYMYRKELSLRAAGKLPPGTCARFGKGQMVYMYKHTRIHYSISYYVILYLLYYIVLYYCNI